MTTTTTTKTRTWKCKCGDFQMKLHNEPYFNAQCSCRSCVASARFIDEHHGKPKGGQSSLTDDGLCSQMSSYFMQDIVFVTDNPEDKMGYVKVGDADKGVVRSYTKCCGTHVFWTGAKFPGPCRNVNRNHCIYEPDGSSYEPANIIGTVMTRFSFDPNAEFPEPKYSIGPFWGMMLGIIGRIIGYELFGIGKERDDKVFFIHPKDVTEIVPITW